MGTIYQFPLKQHIGAPSVPLVKSGDVIRRGQKIAEKEKLGANIFSSITGKVVSVSTDSISILESHTDYGTYIPLDGKTPMELLEESGLVGLGGAGFPTYAKMQAKLSKQGALIINAAECEPILSHNIRRMEEDPEGLIEAMKLGLQILSVKKGVIAVKEKHRAVIEKLEKVLQKQKIDQIRIHKLPDLYPMGEERAIIREVTGNLLGTEELPSKADVVVINAETAYRMLEAVRDKKPLLDKDMTVAGKLKQNASSHILLNVPIGRPVAEIFKMAGGLGAEYGELIMGGPFTGKRTSLEAPVVKTTGGLIATECFMKGPEKLGLLVCACGADKNRLEEIAESLGSTVIDIEYCKQAHEKGSALKCENPGHCPGQVGKILAMKKAGATGVLISNCTDCSNTVMSCAPQLGFSVYHCTDGALRAVNQKLVRLIKE